MRFLLAWVGAHGHELQNLDVHYCLSFQELRLYIFLYILYLQGLVTKVWLFVFMLFVELNDGHNTMKLLYIISVVE